MIAGRAENVAHDVVVAVVGFELDRIGGLRLPAGRASRRIAAVPVIPERRHEHADAVNVVGGQGDAGVALPEQKRVADGVLVRAGLLPLECRTAGGVVVVDRIVVRVDRALAALVQHRRGDVLEDVVFDQLIAAAERVGAVAFRRRPLGAVEVAAANGRVHGLVHPHVLLAGVQAADVSEPDAVAVVNKCPAGRAAGRVVHREILDAAAGDGRAARPPRRRAL